jgi:hypothetical protein
MLMSKIGFKIEERFGRVTVGLPPGGEEMKGACIANALQAITP